MSLIPRPPESSEPDSGASYVTCIFIGLCSPVASFAISLWAFGHFVLRGRPGSQFGYEFLPLLTAPVVAILAYAFGFRGSSALPFSQRCIRSGAYSVVWACALTAAVYLAIYLLLIALQPKSPNHALQRTAPAVTLAASCLRLSPTAQPSRQPPPSLSLGSLGLSRHDR